MAKKTTEQATPKPKQEPTEQAAPVRRTVVGN